MNAWWMKARELAASGEPAALVTVASVAGSAPREPGTKMLVWNSGQLGTVGGGNLEFVIVEQARKFIVRGDAWRFQSYPLGPLLGQCCGGRVGIVVERIGADSLEWLDAIAAAEDAGRPYAIRSTLGDGAIAHHVAASEGGGERVRLLDRDGRLYEGENRFDPMGSTLIEQVELQIPLFMFGAGHVGRALAPIVATLPLRVRWFDNRPEFATPGATIVDDLVPEAVAAPPSALHLIFTQSHETDYQLVRTILARDDFLYCGLIGSATKRARFEKRLVADGIPQARLSRLICPIGAIGLTSKAPEVLAVAIAAELMLCVESRAVRRVSKVVNAR